MILWARGITVPLCELINCFSTLKAPRLHSLQQESVYKTFRHCIAPALQSYISRMHHSHGLRAYASRIIPFNLINSLSKNVLEQKLTLISFLSRFTTRLRPWFSQNLGPLFFTKILLYVSTRIIHRSFPADFDGDCDLMFYPPTFAAKNEVLEPLVWKNNWLVHTIAQ